MRGGDIRQAIEDRVDRYIESWNSGDIQARRRLFAPRAFVEDPVGSVPLEGLEAVVGHWEAMAADGAAFEAKLRRIVVSGREALVEYVLTSVPPHGHDTVTEIFATLEFDAAMEIRRLRIYRDDSCLHTSA